jgi:uncharacterized membrane protein SirB2
MSPTFYYVVHVLAAFALIGWTFSACAAPEPARRGKTLMLTGIASLAMVVAGFGLMAKLGYSFHGWLIAKILCWIVLAALAGIAFRRPGSARVLSLVALAVTGVALYCVYAKPV